MSESSASTSEAAPVFESGIAILVPEAEALVGDWRTRHDPSSSMGAIAHVTLLAPFKPRAEITPTVIDDLTAFFATQPAFDLEFAGVCAFSSTLYLAPEPSRPIEALIEGLVAIFPKSQPYGGAFDHVIPHLTVAYREPEYVEELLSLTAEFCRDLAPRLPVRTRVHTADLSVLDANGRLQSIATLPFVG